MQKVELLGARLAGHGELDLRRRIVAARVRRGEDVPADLGIAVNGAAHALEGANVRSLTDGVLTVDDGEPVRREPKLVVRGDRTYATKPSEGDQPGGTCRRASGQVIESELLWRGRALPVVQRTEGSLHYAQSFVVIVAIQGRPARQALRQVLLPRCLLCQPGVKLIA